MKRFLGWNDWYLHPFTLLYLFLAYCSNVFFNYTLALLIVCIHEMFHYAFAKIFKFDIDGVEVLPFGAFLSLNDYGTHHVAQELIVIMAGLASHFFIYFILIAFGSNEYLLKINVLVFTFNILPIYPLDGSKIFLLILSLFLDYTKAIKLQIKISILSLSILFVLFNNTSYYPVYIYLIYLNYKYIKEYRMDIIRLYLSRLNEQGYKKIKINESYKFYRPYYNLYKFNDCIYSEDKIINELIKDMD